MNLWELARDIYNTAAYKDPDGCVHLRVTEAWAAEDWDRRQARPTVDAGLRVVLDEAANRFVYGGEDTSYIPWHAREDCTTKAELAEWDRIAHILTHAEVAAGPDSLSTAGGEQGVGRRDPGRTLRTRGRDGAAGRGGLPATSRRRRADDTPSGRHLPVGVGLMSTPTGMSTSRGRVDDV